jgi:hypothetical protein
MQPQYPYPVGPPKKKRGLGLIIGIVIGAVLLCGIGMVIVATAGTNKPATLTTAAPGTAPAPAKAEPSKVSTRNAPLGAILSVGLPQGTVEVLVSAVSKPSIGCDGKEHAKFTWVVIDVTVTVTKGTGSINPLFFKFIDSSGNKAEDFAGMFAGCRPLDSGNNMPAGTKRAGQLVYDLKVTTGTLEYGNGMGDAYGSWLIP